MNNSLEIDESGPRSRNFRTRAEWLAHRGLRPYIPSPYPVSEALDEAVLAGLESGAINHVTANAMFAVVAPVCEAHHQPALVIWDGALSCEDCAKDRVKQ